MSEPELRRRLFEVGAELDLDAERVGPFLTRGKCLRGQLVLLASTVAGQGPTARALRYATAIELIHAGALCHDDVVDRSQLRRGEPTVVAGLGARGAVLTGLLLLVRGAGMLATEPVSIRSMVARATRDIARGQTDELADLFAERVSPDAYLRRAYAKTGALYELAASLGAAAAELPAPAAAAVARYGAGVGVAFQLADDLRDFAGGPQLGREAGTDLREGVYTLPVLLTLCGRCPGAEDLRRHLHGGWSREMLEGATALLHQNGAFAETARLAAAEVERAAEALRAFPRTAAVTALENLTRDVLAPAAGPEPAATTSNRLPQREAMGPFLARLVHELYRARAGSRGALAVRDGDGTLAAELAHAIVGLASQVAGAPEDAAVVAVLDLLVADVFGLLPRLSPDEGTAFTTQLATKLRDQLAAAVV